MPPKKSVSSAASATVATAVAALRRTPIEPIHLTPESNVCKIICWNVAGLRGTLKNDPSVFDSLVEKHSPNVICLQETKIQPTHENDFESILPSYTKYWSSSTTKKGYSGTAVFVRNGYTGAVPQPSSSRSEQPTLMSVWGGAGAGSAQKKRKRADVTDPAPPAPTEETPTAQPDERLAVLNSRYDLEGSRFSGEGRVITVEFTSFFLVNAYVPNSGQTLDRLDSRTTEWDPQFFTYLKDLEAKGKPVVLTGDLNVAHLDRDIHNPGAKHIAKQAGLTPQERASFGSLLATGFQDALRFFYPDHEGQFTYWSARTNARPVNKGLRLDYFMCSHSLFCEQQRGVGSSEEGECTGDGVQRRVDDVPVPGVLDSYILHEDTLGCSDHCPIMLVMRL